MLRIPIFTIILGLFIGFKNINIKNHIIWSIVPIYLAMVIFDLLDFSLAQLPIHPDSILMLLSILFLGACSFLSIYLLFYIYLKKYYSLSIIRNIAIILLTEVIRIPLIFFTEWGKQVDKLFILPSLF